MHRRRMITIAIVAVVGISAGLISRSARGVYAQTPKPTPIPTVTGTPTGPIGTVVLNEPRVNVRSGPGPFYPAIGILLPAQPVVLKGRSAGGDWVLIDYPGVQSGTGWVYAYLLNLPPAQLPIIEPPPTPTPLYTATIDPTLAAQFIVTSVPTRLPTYTQAAPLVIPTLPSDDAAGGASGLPMGLVIVGLGILGAFLGLISLLRGR